jgi:hypothetical protein
MPRVGGRAPAEESEDVEGHSVRGRGRYADTPPAKPGTEGRDDVEGHGFRGN